MRITFLSVLLAALFAVPVVADNPLADDPLSGVTRTIDAHTRRASSGAYDPESNIDSYHVQGGETRTLCTLKGPGEIRHMWFTIMGLDRRWPRTAVLRIYWDGAKTPSVETPVGDFFAAGNGMTANVHTLPIQNTSYGRALNCYWVMPFFKEARIEIANEGMNDLCVYWQFDWMELPKLSADTLYFHARYRQELPTKPTFAPYVIFDGTGQGQYVGTVLSLQCSYGSWFGESDDRFYIDGEAEPSLIGTGCEDFFNDAWNFREFNNENTGVTIKEPNGEDCRFTAYRWHFRAPVVFRKSLKIECERRSFAVVTNPKTGRTEQHDFKYRPDFCSSVSFWYQKNVARRTEPFPTVDQRLNKEIMLETTDLAPTLKTSPGTRAYQTSNRVCNRKMAMHVDNTKVGGWFEVPCHVDEAGTYSISAFQCLFRNGGIWKVTLDGPTGHVVLDKAMDFYDPYLAWRENRPENYLYGTWLEKKLGLQKLTPGDYTFRFECIGANPLSRQSLDDMITPGYNCRLDGISLRRFPWDDLYGQMKEYLRQEKLLFGAWQTLAATTVGQLDAAIRRFHGDTGQYPATLDDLVIRPARLPASVQGNWPYVEKLARDPWGQLYRYDCPGRFNPDSFDVYSVHGNSRDSSLWIGNWSSAFRLEGALEGEELPVVNRGNVALSRQRLWVRSSAPSLSAGQLLFARFKRKGDAIELALPESIKPGNYHVRLQLVTARDYGAIGAAANGQSLGEPVDTFSFVVGTKAVTLGPVALKPGKNTLRLEAAGRNPKSQGYCLGLDAVTLVPSP
jgi:hypothetical protein